jgi:hypothetical protein
MSFLSLNLIGYDVNFFLTNISTRFMFLFYKKTTFYIILLLFYNLEQIFLPSK